MRELVKFPLGSSVRSEKGCKQTGSGKPDVSIDCYVRMNRRKKNGITFERTQCARDWSIIGRAGRIAWDSNCRAGTTGKRERLPYKRM